MNDGINLLYIAMICGVIAVLYGVFTSRQVLAMVSGAAKPAATRFRAMAKSMSATSRAAIRT